jgi:hypothetical protein
MELDGTDWDLLVERLLDEAFGLVDAPRFPGRGIDTGAVPAHSELVVQFSLESKTCLH